MRVSLRVNIRVTTSVYMCLKVLLKGYAYTVTTVQPKYTQRECMDP